MTDEDKTAAFAAHRPAGLEPRSAFILVLADPEDPHHVAAHYVGPFLDEASAAAWHDEASARRPSPMVGRKALVSELIR